MIFRSKYCIGPQLLSRAEQHGLLTADLVQGQSAGNHDQRYDEVYRTVLELPSGPSARRGLLSSFVPSLHDPGVLGNVRIELPRRLSRDVRSVTVSRFLDLPAPTDAREEVDA